MCMQKKKEFWALGFEKNNTGDPPNHFEISSKILFAWCYYSDEKNFKNTMFHTIYWIITHNPSTFVRKWRRGKKFRENGVDFKITNISFKSKQTYPWQQVNLLNVHTKKLYQK